MPSSKVKEIIADVLYLDAGTVTSEANLTRDLGAESIDFLDIIFRLEQEFGISLPRGEIERRAKDGLSDDEFAVNGLIQDRGLDNLRQQMPEVDASEIKTGLYVRDIPSLFTVASFERMVQEQLGTSVPAATTVQAQPSL